MTAEIDEEPASAGRLSSLIEPDTHPVWIIHRVLREMREQLDIEVSFVSEVTEGQRLFRFVGGDTASFGIEVDLGDPLEQTLCERVMRTVEARAVPDVASDPQARQLAVVAARDIAAYLGVPIVCTDGRVYGTLCVLSHAAQPSLDANHLGFLRVAAALVAEQLDREELVALPRERTRAQVEHLIEHQELQIAYQPIIDLHDGRLAGVEALARFPGEPRRSPDEWFADAWAVGLGCELELAAVDLALDGLAELPPDVYLAVNLSPDALLEDATMASLLAQPGERLVLEVTEHAPIRDHAPLRERLRVLREHGFRIALDDIGTGYSTLSLLVELEPDIHKLDVSVVQGVHQDATRRALVAGLVGFATTIGARSIAEGIETSEELELLRSLGVDAGQGYHLGRPGEPPSTRTPPQR